ncbi:DUF6228 family protein [Shewanella algae]|uniref:DUF6228 family protein n=2 Tax=Shewanella TaxID=22 RepID=UPI000AD32363|nr:DUF6228 family protein [Shewanella algae]NKZ41027.1 hypothetical protein [Shewanella algae]QTE79708.1 hypothetical protein E1N14_008910 [Shewanella algae]
MKEWILKNSFGCSVRFHKPELDISGWLKHYCVTISGEGMQASVRVDNLPYGRNPADFFEELARQWQGWQGEQSWAAIEGEYSLVATTDACGHLLLTVSLLAKGGFPAWSAEVSLAIDAGQLQALAMNGKDFFYPAPAGL